MDIQEIGELIARCMSCGLCIEACQVLEVRSLESWGPRGWITISREWLGEGFDGSEGELIQRIYSCLLCGRCEAFCPYRVGVREIFEGVRRLLVDRGFLYEKIRQIEENVDAYGNPMGIEKGAMYRGLRRPKCETLLFRGCVTSAYAREELKAAEVILNSCSLSFTEFMDEVCCGYPLEILGLEEKAGEIYRRNYKTMIEKGIEKLVAACPHCYQAFKERYPRYVEGFELDVQLLEEVYHTLIDEGRLVPLRRVDLQVTYQNPCVIGRTSEYNDFMTEILETVPSMKMMRERDTPRKAKCCGGGSFLFFLDSELQAEISKRRVEEFLSSGVHAVVASCPICIYTLGEPARGRAIAISGVSKLLALSAGLLD